MTTSFKAAEREATRLEEYWESFGYRITTRIIAEPDPRGNPTFSVHSDLTNGLPPGFRAGDIQTLEEAIQPGG
jgi:hypothetical protein